MVRCSDAAFLWMLLEVVNVILHLLEICIGKWRVVVIFEQFKEILLVEAIAMYDLPTMFQDHLSHGCSFFIGQHELSSLWIGR